MRWLRRRLRTKSIDLTKLELISEGPLDRLKDPSYLEHELLPHLGLNNDFLHQIPRRLHPHTGKGLLHWQVPNQFGEYLVKLSECRIESYLEIGIRHGGTFVITIEYLDRFTPIRRAVGIDLGEPSDSIQQYAASRSGVTVRKADSHSDEFAAFIRASEPFDLVLIDGDHSEEGCREDFELVIEKSRIVVFHDIVSHPVPGVGKVWQEVKDTHASDFDFFEYTEQYPVGEYPDGERDAGRELFGIGVAVSRSAHESTPRARS